MPFFLLTKTPKNGNLGIKERCLSGRKGRFRKPLLSSDDRGFESHPLRYGNDFN